MAQLPFSFSLVGGWFYGTSLSLYIYRATSLWEFCVWRYQTGCEWHKTRTHKTAYLHSCSSLKRKKMYLSLASEFWVLLLDSSNLDLRLVDFCGLKMRSLHYCCRMWIQLGFCIWIRFQIQNHISCDPLDLLE